MNRKSPSQFLFVARSLNCPLDQVRNFARAGLVLQPTRLSLQARERRPNRNAASYSPRILHSHPVSVFCFTPATRLSSDTGVTTYAEWRLRNGLVPILREDRESPPEALLQAIWQHQRLRRDELRTAADGRPVRVLHPGFRSVEGGPDFRGAVVQFGDDPPRSGDVEVDVRPGGWRAHGHDRNPAFEKVILHVVWE